MGDLTAEARASSAVVHRNEAIRSSVALWARRHAAPLWGSLFVVVSGMVVSLLWPPLVDHVSMWLTPGDLWGTFRDAHLIGWGGEADIYQAGTGYLSPPGFPMLLAPLAMVSGALHLTESFPLDLPHPTAWLLLGPAELLSGSVVLFPIDALARRLGVPHARRVAVVWTCAGLSVPPLLLWGHPEDLLAVACGLYGLLAAFDGRCTKAAALLGVGMTFQPLVVLVAPLVFARMPWRLWARAGVMAVLPSALLLAAPVVHTWRTTLHAIVDQPTFPKIGHATPWLALAPVLEVRHVAHTPGRLFATTTEVTAGGPGRVVALAIAVALGILVARARPSERALVGLAAGCLALRCVFESVMFPYYVVPALLVAVLGSAALHRWRFALSVGAAAGCSWAAYVQAPRWSYYFVVTGLLLAACVLAAPRGDGTAPQKAGDPAGGGVAPGSKGSRPAPQSGSVRGAWALPVAGEVVDVDDAETVAMVRALGGVVAGAAEP